MRSRRRTRERKAVLTKPQVEPRQVPRIGEPPAAPAEPEVVGKPTAEPPAPVPPPADLDLAGPSETGPGDIWDADQFAPNPGASPVLRVHRERNSAVVVKPRESRQRRQTEPPPPPPTPPATMAPEVARLAVPDDGQPVHAVRTHDVTIERVAAKPKPEDAKSEEWTGAPAMSGRTLAKMMAGGVLVVAAGLAAVLVLHSLNRDSGTAPLGYATLEMTPEEAPLDNRLALFLESPAGVQKEALHLLAGYGAARTAREAEPWVRTSTAGDEMPRRWRPWTSPPRIDQPDMIQFSFLENHAIPFMVAWGIRENFTPYCAYFARDHGKLRLDWEATEGLCDIPIPDLPAATEVRGALVRCELEIKPFHTGSFPESRYRSYALNTADQLNWVWGYVERDSQLDGKLREILNDGTNILEHKLRERVTLRVAMPANRDLPSQFLITDMLHNEWLCP